MNDKARKGKGFGVVWVGVGFSIYILECGEDGWEGRKKDIFNMMYVKISGG
jgi:hypothetical protein